MTKHVAVLGAGAMGSLFGGLLAEGGMQVTLIDPWKEHIEAINRDGLPNAWLWWRPENFDQRDDQCR